MSPAMLVKRNYQLVQVDDGLVVASSSRSLGVREWLRGLGKNLWTFEPLEDAPASRSVSPQHSAEDAKILRFSDDIHTKHGKRSVISVRRPLFCTLLKEM
jgi:hypothetical protein